MRETGRVVRVVAEIRPIDANSLARWLEANRANLNSIDCDGKEAYYECITMVEAMRTLDVEPVRHGHWIESSPINIWRCYDCSECKFGVSGGKPNYCPNCGAKMDGGSNCENQA